MKVLIVGGGIAGLGCAWHLARSGRVEVTVVETESGAFQHASGKNAGIFRMLETELELVELAERSLSLLRELEDETDVLQPCNLLLTSNREAALSELIAVATASGIRHSLISGSELLQHCPALVGGQAEYGILLPQAGVFDLFALQTQLLRRSRALGVNVRFEMQADQILVHAGQVRGIQFSDGSSLFANHVVVASGAFSSVLSSSVGLACPLLPHRRHLAQLLVDAPLQAGSGIIWDVELGAYFRPQDDGILASPGDETPHPATLPSNAPEALLELGRKLALLCPSFAAFRVKHYWACLRTLSPDRLPVLGPERSLPGFHWLSGLGGHGMSAGLAAGELVAQAILGEASPLAERLSAERFRIHTP